MVDYIKFINSLDGFLLPELREIIISYFIPADIGIDEFLNPYTQLKYLSHSTYFKNYRNEFLNGKITYNIYREKRDYERKLDLFFKQSKNFYFDYKKYKELYNNSNFDNDYCLLGTILDKLVP